jgi:hypothetical protein
MRAFLPRRQLAEIQANLARPACECRVLVRIARKAGEQDVYGGGCQGRHAGAARLKRQHRQPACRGHLGRTLPLAALPVRGAGVRAGGLRRRRRQASSGRSATRREPASPPGGVIARGRI